MKVFQNTTRSGWKCFRTHLLQSESVSDTTFTKWKCFRHNSKKVKMFQGTPLTKWKCFRHNSYKVKVFQTQLVQSESVSVTSRTKWKCFRHNSYKVKVFQTQLVQSESVSGYNRKWITAGLVSPQPHFRIGSQHFRRSKQKISTLSPCVKRLVRVSD